MLISDANLDAMHTFFDDLWREVIPTLQPIHPPFAKKDTKGFKVSRNPRAGYTQLAEGDEDLWAYQNRHQCDKAAYVMYPVVVKVLGDEVEKVEIAYLWVEPVRLIEEWIDMDGERRRRHTVIVYTLKDGRKRVIDPSRSQFGIKDVKKSYHEYLDAYAPATPPDQPQLMTFGGYATFLRRGLGDDKSWLQELFFYKLLAANVTITYNKWEREYIQGGISAVDVLGGGQVEAKEGLSKAMKEVTLRVREMVDAGKASMSN
ncbi:hypothetical protein BU16DRAFT_544617 [Lophium mytilinum]|uniref:Uncharacterized protein n=1 Tax=Lophium mytilinum TaxID=390894 RepID=A0A6A6QAQ3_9PEZI|nr:hypothetical protein BU16DRAFT_544617 [Lophium mytilinum]